MLVKKTEETTVTTTTQGGANTGDVRQPGELRTGAVRKDFVPPEPLVKAMRGFLKKQSPSILHRWQNRYFMVVPSTRTIVYFKDQEDANDNNKMKGQIPIGEIKHIESRDETDFHLVCPERTYNLRAENAIERKKWIQSIRGLREGNTRLNHHVHHELQPSATLPKKHISEKETVITGEKLVGSENTTVVTDNTVQGYPGTISNTSEFGDHDDEVHYYSASTQLHETDSNKVREFIIVEKVIGGNGKEKTYRFTAPKNSEVNIKFTKAIAPVEVLNTMTTGTLGSNTYIGGVNTMTTGTLEGNTYIGSVDTTKPLITEQMTTSEYVSGSNLGVSQSQAAVITTNTVQ